MTLAHSMGGLVRQEALEKMLEATSAGYEHLAKDIDSHGVNR